jgi:hypothetical protein
LVFSPWTTSLKLACNCCISVWALPAAMALAMASRADLVASGQLIDAGVLQVQPVADLLGLVQQAVDLGLGRRAWPVRTSAFLA